MTIKKYSKSSAFYLSAKDDFFSKNQELLDNALNHNNLYRSQPRRFDCKLCQTKLSGAIDFSSHGVGYTFCDRCNHLNGIYDDTQSFVDQIYITNGGENYKSNYLSKDFEERITEVYLPKIDFLLNVIPSESKKILDVGCGSGHFVGAALRHSLDANGIDVNRSMIEFGNLQLQHIAGCSPLSFIEEDGFFEVIKTTDAEIISAIGVIEHLREPQKLFEAFKKSNARYLYYCVPMFSLTVAIENVFTHVYPRHLSGGHTHLFTEESLTEMNSIMNIKPIGEWRFGTDMMDLYRHLLIGLKSNKASQKMIDQIRSEFIGSIDALQNILDTSHFCSEIHVVAEKY